MKSNNNKIVSKERKTSSDTQLQITSMREDVYPLQNLEGERLTISSLGELAHSPSQTPIAGSSGAFIYSLPSTVV